MPQTTESNPRSPGALAQLMDHTLLKPDATTADINRAGEVMADDWQGLCFTNLVDFDARYGHRRATRARSSRYASSSRPNRPR